MVTRLLKKDLYQKFWGRKLKKTRMISSLTRMQGHNYVKENVWEQAKAYWQGHSVMFRLVIFFRDHMDRFLLIPVFKKVCNHFIRKTSYIKTTIQLESQKLLICNFQ